MTPAEKKRAKAALLFAFVDADMVARLNRAHASHAYAALVPAAQRRLGAWRMTWWR
jgi:hypothetical protein